MLFLMMYHPNFDKMLEKYVPSKDLPYIKESVKSLRHKVCGKSLLSKQLSKQSSFAQKGKRNNYFFIYMYFSNGSAK